MATELTIVVPTYNERHNIGPLVHALQAALAGISWEVIFVDDDSADGTADLVRDLSRTTPEVRCLQRLRRRGLASACVEGMLASASPFIAVMDADMQHDETLLATMLAKMRAGNDDVIVASRYSPGASTGELSRSRAWLSRLATVLSRTLIKTELSDPMSGFFMVRRDFFQTVMRRLYGKGFKILLDIFASADAPVRCTEIPYQMRARRQGVSKLGPQVTLEFLMLLLYKMSGRLISGRFIMFSTVGLTGVAVHLSVLYLIYLVAGKGFVFAQSLATLVAMTSNFILNNNFTYRDQRLEGLNILVGLMTFYLACSLGAIISVALGSFLNDNGFPWWLAGSLGALAAAVWNFTMTSSFTWSGRRFRRKSSPAVTRAND